MTRDSQKTNKPTGNSSTVRTRRKMAVFVIEIMIIIAMIGVLYYVMKHTENEYDKGPIYADAQSIDPASIGISESVVKASEPGGSMEGYTNIALFGVDALSTNGSDLLKGYRSDCLMIASINNATGEVSLVSVYRDTYLNLADKDKDTYNKCNAAYAKGGATQAVAMLNSNLDLNITYWVTVSYKALSTVVDDLGGIMINVETDEIDHLNNYQIAVAQVLGVSEDEIVPVRESGYQLLNGMQASAYCRIRYTSGNDFARTKRQQEVVEAIMEAAKGQDAATLTNVFSDVMNYTYTSIDEKTFLNMILNISDYKIVREGGFPSMELMAGANLPAKGDCVIPMNLEANVIELHRFLFGDEHYEVSDTVRSYSESIALDTGSYIRN